MYLGRAVTAPQVGQAPGRGGIPPSAPRGLAPFMSEASLLAAVVDLARILGLLCYHTRDSRGSAAGFPDVVIVGPRGVLFRELKTASGKLTRYQSLWGQGLTEAGESWAVWRPEDLAAGRIQDQLRALCARLNRGGES